MISNQTGGANVRSFLAERSVWKVPAFTAQGGVGQSSAGVHANTLSLPTGVPRDAGILKTVGGTFLFLRTFSKNDRWYVLENKNNNSSKNASFL